MSDSDRLQELRRQRALEAERLAKLDREIAAASGSPTPPVPTVPPPALASGAAAAPPAEVTAAAEAMLDEYRVAPDALKSDVKKGCLLYFFGALGLFAMGVMVLYFAFRHGK